MSKLTIHPLCAIFPDLQDAEFDEMVARMKAAKSWRGHDPIHTYSGQILDGKNRERAAHKAGVVPQYQEWKPQSDKPALIEVELRDFVLAKNLLRRHLDESQRAMVAAELANLQHGQRKRPENKAKKPDASIDASGKVSQDDAAEMLSVSRKSVQRAATVLAEATEPVQEAVRDRTVKVSDAENVAELPTSEQNAALKAVKSGESPTLTAAAYKSAIETIRGVNSKAASDIETGRWALPKKRVIELAASSDVAKALRDLRLGNTEPENPTATTNDRMATEKASLESFARELQHVWDNCPETFWFTGNEKGIAGSHLKAILDSVRSAKGYATCPKCDGKKCRHCRQSGWMPRVPYESNGGKK